MDMLCGREEEGGPGLELGVFCAEDGERVLGRAEPSKLLLDC